MTTATRQRASRKTFVHCDRPVFFRALLASIVSKNPDIRSRARIAGNPSDRSLPRPSTCPRSKDTRSRARIAAASAFPTFTGKLACLFANASESVRLQNNEFRQPELTYHIDRSLFFFEGGNRSATSRNRLQVFAMAKVHPLSHTVPSILFSTSSDRSAR